MKFENEIMNDMELENVSGGTTIQTISLLTTLQDIGVKGIPDGLTLKSERDIVFKPIEALNCLSGVLKKYGIDSTLSLNFKNKYVIDGRTAGAKAVVAHIKKQL